MSELEEAVDEVVDDTGADRQEIRASFENLIIYGVPIKEAKLSVRRKHGGDDE